MRFKLENGKMVLQKECVVEKMQSISPISSAYVIDIPKLIDKSKNYLNTSGVAYSVAPVWMLGNAMTPVGASTGVFWNAFLQYIFPWVLDVGKVYCCIRIAQAFWQERRGGRDGESGISALLTHGKWYLCLWLLPWGVELIDGIGGTMFENLRSNPINIPTTR